MNIAIVDVAAESGGALSVLMDFLDYLLSIDDDNNEYYIFVSQKINIKNKRFHIVRKPGIKKSWFRRLKWELIDAKKEFLNYKIETIISLQNTGFFFSGFKQIVYFHNVLLLENKNKYSLFNREERKYALYTRLIAPYTMRSMRNSNTIICQTNTVKDQLISYFPQVDVVVITPNVNVDKKYIDTARYPIKGFIYPASAVPFKRIEEIVECVDKNITWFIENGLEVLITIKGNENDYAKRIREKSKNVSPIKLIGYQSRESVLHYYADHVLIVNSELESFPLPFKEAEIIGTSIVAANYPYAKEILADYPLACIYRIGDLDNMMHMIKKSLDLPHVKYSVDSTNSWGTLMNSILSGYRKDEVT